MSARARALVPWLVVALCACDRPPSAGDPEAEAMAEVGWLKLRSRPGDAEVWIDGRRVGRTPDDRSGWLDLEVDAGWMELFAVADGERFAALELFVGADVELTKLLELEPLTPRARARVEELLLGECSSLEMESCRRLEAWSDRLGLGAAEWSEIDRAARRRCAAGEMDGCLLSANLVYRERLGPASAERVAATFGPICAAGEPRGCLFAEGFGGTGWGEGFRGRGAGGWRRAAGCAVGGGPCLWSGETLHEESSTVGLALELAIPGEISFRYRAEREACCDRLELILDGETVVPLEKIGAVETYRQPIGPGPHTFEWRYRKDGAVSEGADAAWIDDLVVTGVLRR